MHSASPPISLNFFVDTVCDGDVQGGTEGVAPTSYGADSKPIGGVEEVEPTADGDDTELTGGKDGL